MNANELAQEFEEYLKEIEELPWGNHQILCDQAADLLRQQQDEITVLKQILSYEGIEVNLNECVEEFRKVQEK